MTSGMAALIRPLSQIRQFSENATSQKPYVDKPTINDDRGMPTGGNEASSGPRIDFTKGQVDAAFGDRLVLRHRMKPMMLEMRLHHQQRPVG